MIGKKQELRPKLFYHGICLEDRLPADHPLRRIKSAVDFSFVRPLVAPCYGKRGKTSVDPIILLKLMFLLFYEKVSSERALMAQLPLRLDWLWFCDYDLDDPTPDHSVLSKARRRWGQAVFADFFQRVLAQCVAAGLVDGRVIHVDSSMIDGNAGKDRLQRYLRVVGQEVYDRLETAADAPSGESPTAPESLDEPGGSDPIDPSLTPGQRFTPVDPDARLAKKYGHSTLGYKDHRTIDDQCGIITSTITTPANLNDDKVLAQAVETHEQNTARTAEMVVADKIYGTTDNYRRLREQNKECCIPHQRHGVRANDAVSHDKFIYDAARDCYVCPGGRDLKRYDHDRPHDGGIRYRADRQVCEGCPYFSACVRSKKHGRQIRRNLENPYVVWADGCCTGSKRKYLLGRRRSRAEGSFADASNNHGFKRARWRGLVKMTIQNLMIGAIQNLRKLLRYGLKRDLTRSQTAFLMFLTARLIRNRLKCPDLKRNGWRLDDWTELLICHASLL